MNQRKIRGRMNHKKTTDKQRDFAETIHDKVQRLLEWESVTHLSCILVIPFSATHLFRVFSFSIPCWNMWETYWFTKTWKSCISSNSKSFLLFWHTFSRLLCLLSLKLMLLLSRCCLGWENNDTTKSHPAFVLRHFLSKNLFQWFETDFCVIWRWSL